MTAWWILCPAFVDLRHRTKMGVELRRERKWVSVVGAALAVWTVVMILVDVLAR